MASGNEPVCKVCYNELDITDRSFQACECGFQVCMFCWHKLRETGKGRCPGCRTEYGDAPIRTDEIPPEVLERERVAMKRAQKSKRGAVRDGLTAKEQTELATAINISRQQREDLLRRAGHLGAATAADAAVPSALGDAAMASGPPTVASVAAAASRARPKSPSPHPGQSDALKLLETMAPADREGLRDARVIQRNLVYVTGLAPQYAVEEVLAKADFFGQYGDVLKVVVNRSNLAASGGRPPSASAYITFGSKEQAETAVRSVSGHRLDGRVLKASFGTNKYCAALLRGTPCMNPECMYLHTLGSDHDSFSKEQMANPRFLELTTPARSGAAAVASGHVATTVTAMAGGGVRRVPVTVGADNGTGDATGAHGQAAAGGARSARSLGPGGGAAAGGRIGLRPLGRRSASHRGPSQAPPPHPAGLSQCHVQDPGGRLPGAPRALAP